jgi:hypothetical protein
MVADAWTSFDVTVDRAVARHDGADESKLSQVRAKATPEAVERARLVDRSGVDGQPVKEPAHLVEVRVEPDDQGDDRQHQDGDDQPPG